MKLSEITTSNAALRDVNFNVKEEYICVLNTLDILRTHKNLRKELMPEVNTFLETAKWFVNFPWQPDPDVDSIRPNLVRMISEVERLKLNLL